MQPPSLQFVFKPSRKHPRFPVRTAVGHQPLQCKSRYKDRLGAALLVRHVL